MAFDEWGANLPPGYFPNPGAYKGTPGLSPANLPGARPWQIPVVAGQPVPANATSLYQFLLAALTLYLIARFVPYGTEVAGLILLVALVLNPETVSAFGALVTFIQTGA